ncbi:pancreatic triacylglycerol lipase isoform X2 [Rhipicephalus sanguineus]|uniref:pancreatic triacylglycerol lipase isoform X2 n=1 Tax=Rhipicephalus sanguineus TaxID=34632 RepID=UPI0020C49735|nr:pancreatic triacylglycerol lipase isoform X2 [Rhipicephalus sanguineus]
MSVRLARASVAVIVFAVCASVAQIKTKTSSVSEGEEKVDEKTDGIWPLKFTLKSISLIKDMRCYRGVGCFRKDDKYRLTHPLSLPRRPRYVRTKFYIYSRNNTGGRRLRTRFLRRDGKPFFQELKDLIIVAHGYTQNVNSSWLHELKEALLQEKDCNVVIVDWGRGCRSPLYLTAVGNTALVGRQISLLVQKLSRKFDGNVTAANVHLIGFSLGAQVCGFAGRHYKKQTGTKLARISEIDCDHGRAPLYYIESLTYRRQCRFVTYKCKGGIDAFRNGLCAPGQPSGEMGYYSNLAPGRGLQFLKTNEHSPFCLPMNM